MSERTEVPRLLTVDQAAELTGLNVRGLLYSDPDFAASCIVRIGRRVRVRADRLAAFIESATGAPPVEYVYRKTPGRPPKSATAGAAS